MIKITTAIKKILKTSKRLRIIQGSTGAGKTIAILLYLIDMAQTDKFPTITSIVSESLPHLKRGAMRDFITILTYQGYFKESNFNRTDFIYTFENGSKIEFFGANQEEKVKGLRRHRLFINECNNISYDVFNQLEIRTSDFIFLDYNPDKEFWIFTEILNKRPKDDYDYLILTYKDNEALPIDIVKAIEARKDNKNWFRVYGQGLLAELEGKIYNNWEIIPSIPDDAKLLGYGLDFGFVNDPTAMVAIYYIDNSYIFDEIIYKTGLKNSDLINIIKSLPEKAAVYADSAEPKTIKELRDAGLNVIPAKKTKDSVKWGIQYIQGLNCKITESSINLIKEYRNYFWLPDKSKNKITENSKPDHKYSHLMDAIRYFFLQFSPSLIDDKRNFRGFDTTIKRISEFEPEYPDIYQNPIIDLNELAKW
ncbi:MAG: phage terminase large subunit [Patescibacteria group bacterium]|nr:phage terminase large subunit [Patescibacteria group bacterium]